jgi:hypothetical protein
MDDSNNTGHLRFLLVRGVLCWGLPVGAVNAGLMAFAEGRHSFARALPLSLAVFGAAGLLLGEMVWRFEKRRRAPRS